MKGEGGSPLTVGSVNTQGTHIASTPFLLLFQNNIECPYKAKKLYVYRVAKFSPKVCSRLTTKVADLVVPARFLVILFLMQFVLSSQSDIFIGFDQYSGKGVCCGRSIASVSDLSKSFHTYKRSEYHNLIFVRYLELL